MMIRRYLYGKTILATFRSGAARTFATRSEYDSPFAYLPVRQKAWIPWKTATFFFLLGSYVSYSETLFDIYDSLTTVDEEDKLLALRLLYKLKHLPIYERLAHPKQEGTWIKLESWENLDRNILENKTTAVVASKECEYEKHSVFLNTLAQPGGILVKPVIFYNLKTGESVTIMHVGSRLCGYPYIIHGGILATILNECFKRNASLSSGTKSTLKDDFKVENLCISYKAPSFADQFIVIKTERDNSSSKEHNRDLSLNATIESQNGKVLVESEALLKDTGRASKLNNMKEPKWYSLIS